MKPFDLKTAHTQGPWNIYFNSQDSVVIRKMFADGQESHSIAVCNSGLANALLIAAAPELLEALLSIVGDKGVQMVNSDLLNQALAAITKATGETEMRCKVTRNHLPAIWEHPDLKGQLIAAFTREDARGLVMKITDRDLPVEAFKRTGMFAWRERMLSTADDLALMVVPDKDMKE